MSRPPPPGRNRQLLSRMRVALVAVIAASAGLMTVYSGGSLRMILLALGGGAVLGVGLVWIALPRPSDDDPGGRRGRR
jgi:ABC-type Na+ efflux pump permease subunit